MSTFQVFNDNLVLQVDSDYNNFRLLRTLRVIGAFNSPKKFVCEPNMLYAVAPYSRGSSIAITPNFTNINGEIRESYNVYGDVIFFEFTHEKRQPSLHATGFEMYDEQGQVILTSEDIMLRVKKYIYGNLTNVAKGTTLDYSQSYYFHGNEKPTRAYVLGIVPRKFTGGNWQNVPIGTPYTVTYKIFYQVSTLFFQRLAVDTYYEQFAVKFDQFYYSDPYTRTYTSTKKYEVNYIPIYDSTNSYSVLEIDLTTQFNSIPEPILVP